MKVLSAGIETPKIGCKIGPKGKQVGPKLELTPEFLEDLARQEAISDYKVEDDDSGDA